MIKKENNHVKNEQVNLSIIVLYENEDKAILKTIQSLLSSYQQGLCDENIEVIILDSVSISDKTGDFGEFKDKITHISLNQKNLSIFDAYNYAITVASANLIGVMVGAEKIVTPGLCEKVIQTNRANSEAVITALNYQLGPAAHSISHQKGYNNSAEDAMLTEIDWIKNGYDLFLSCDNPNKECLNSRNSLGMVFMTKDMWLARGCSKVLFSQGSDDESQKSLNFENTQIIQLINEATFQQMSTCKETNNSIQNVKVLSNLSPIMIDDLIPQVEYLYDDKSQAKYKAFHEIQSGINIALAQLTDGLYFKEGHIANKNLFSSWIDAPVILIGRGGSGTRILSKLIQELGLFLGHELNESDDSQEWVELIYDLVINRKFISNHNFGQHEVDKLRNNAIKVLKKTNSSKQFLWGFKLPENMLCMPELLKAFPRVKFILLTRHPITISMRRSHLTSRLDNKIGHYVLEQGYKQLNKDFENAANEPVYINNAVSWHYQLSHVLQYSKHNLNNSNYCQLKYEELCANPVRIRNIILDFLNLKDHHNVPINNLIDEKRITKLDYKANLVAINQIWEICGALAKQIRYEKRIANFGYRKKVIFVLGMHRSGTSAITRVLNIMGASLPNNLMQPNSDNQSGYWESKDIVFINNQLFKLAGTSWFDNDKISESWLNSHEINELKNSAINLIKSNFNSENKECLVIKDPRICRLLPFWHGVMDELGVKFVHVFIYRDPIEVFMSFKARYDKPQYKAASIIHAEKLNLLWSRYVLEAEYHSRNFERYFINYQDLIDSRVDALVHLKGFVSKASSVFTINRLNSDLLYNSISNSYHHHKNSSNKFQKELRLSSEIYKILLESSNVETQRVVNNFIKLRTQYNHVSDVYFDLMPKLKNKIHQNSPFFGEMSRAISNSLNEQLVDKKILFFSGSPESKGHTYRVVHLMEALGAAGISVTYQSLENSLELEELKKYSAVVMFRVPWDEKIESIYSYCDKNNIIKIFDVDDLVILPEIMTKENWDFLRLKNKKVISQWNQLFQSYAKTASQSDHITVTTNSLANAVKEIGKPVHVINNGIGQLMLKSAEKVLATQAIKPSESDGIIRLGYASGSPTHQKDFEEIYQVICQILKEFENTKLIIIGHLNLEEFPLLMPFIDRIEKRPLVEHMELFSEYYGFDINLAPLQSNNIFCDCKSQLKYHESGLVSVPTIASATGPYMDAIHSGITGYFAKDEGEWYHYLTLLIKDKDLRIQIGQSANKHVILRFGPKTQKASSSLVYADIFESSTKSNNEN